MNRKKRFNNTQYIFNIIKNNIESKLFCKINIGSLDIRLYLVCLLDSIHGETFAKGYQNLNYLQVYTLKIFTLTSLMELNYIININYKIDSLGSQSF